MIRRTIREWERIEYGCSETSIPEINAGRIVAAARASSFAGAGGDGVLDHGRTALRARGIVGVIAAPGCQLEILPKIEGAAIDDHTDAVLRSRLIHMLGAVYNLPVDVGSWTGMGWQRETVLELLIRLFCVKLMEAVRQGLPRQYLSCDDDLSVLRGRLDVIRQFSILAAAPHKLACRFDTLSPDNAINQVMRAAVAKLSHISQAAENQRLLRELTLIYSDVSAISNGTLPWGRIVLDRTNWRWTELLSIAKLLLTGRHQQTSTGANEGFALLFEMNVLFEQYVSRLLDRALAGSGLRVSAQGGGRHCLFEDENGWFVTRPDLIIRQGDDIKLIIDTKWKRIAARLDDPKQGISQADVYQMMAYEQVYRCPAVMLLYPHHSGLPREPVRRSYTIAGSQSDKCLSVTTLDLTISRQQQETALRKLVADATSHTW